MGIALPSTAWSSPTFFRAAIPRVDNARLIDLPAGISTLRMSGLRSYIFTSYPRLAKYTDTSEPANPPPTNVILFILSVVKVTHRAFLFDICFNLNYAK
jgi:hypothetical protein